MVDGPHSDNRLLPDPEHGPGDTPGWVAAACRIAGAILLVFSIPVLLLCAVTMGIAAGVVHLVARAHAWVHGQ